MSFLMVDQERGWWAWSALLLLVVVESERVKESMEGELDKVLEEASELDEDKLVAEENRRIPLDEEEAAEGDAGAGTPFNMHKHSQTVFNSSGGVAYHVASVISVVLRFLKKFL
jgi:hypothetical protein